ncbi:hypothetical protein I350_00637 [Cryptococcus amylolentus CBS 6273]|uniref:Cytoplasmic tRNA 2-thiolation protein 2 n=1 Tax=Cryptococcus amylolentus CBS 6273 TaxID=1296118 RepID=A0A1E3KG27_9TREE|nr:hypothetical protein I350_00637 [Cryptococcus amylolentus CBS 6273]
MACGNLPEGQGTENEEQVNMPRRRKVRRVDKSICQKCQQVKSLYIFRNITYCKPCLEAAIFARITKSLHPPLKPQRSTSRMAATSGHRPPPQSGSALVCLSSGCGSTTMLDLLLSKQYIGKGAGIPIDRTKGEKEPIWSKGYVVYVEFGGALNVEERTKEIREWVEQRQEGLEFIGVRAEDVYDPAFKSRLRQLGGAIDGEEVSDIQPLSINLKDSDLPLFPVASSTSTTTPLDQLRTLLASLPPASRPQILSHILSSLVTAVAHALPNISHVLLGETSTRQAQRLISGTASGRGWQLPLELSAVRTEPPVAGTESRGLVWLKPLKDLTTKEAAVYCHIKGLSQWTRNDRKWEVAGPVGKRDARGKGGVASLEMLTEQFIAGLSVTHPSTVSTINRTGDKLVFPGKEEERPHCPVCQLPIDPSALEWKSRTGLTSLPTKLNPMPASTPSTPEATLAPLLCYSCLTTFTPPTVVSKARLAEEGNVENVALPLWIREGVERRNGGGAGMPVGREAMKEQIKDFLIGE